MTRQRRRLLSLALASIVAGLATPALMLALSYRLIERNAMESLRGYATILNNRASEVFSNAESTLSELAPRIERNCTDNTYRELRTAVYNSLYFREAGLIYGSAVQCTSQQIFDPPIPITNPDHLVMPQDGIHIAAPQSTLEGEVSIIVLYRVDEAIGVNLLLNPAHLIEPLLGVADMQHVRFQVQRSDGALLAQVGTLAAQASPSGEPPAEAREEDTLEVSRTLSAYPVRIVVSSSRAWLLRDWSSNLTQLLGLGLVLSLPIFLMLKRYERRGQAMDTQIRDALEAGELRVYYQPIHSVDGSRIVGAEALLRWEHPRRGIIMPSVFVPVAEETGFIVPLTDWLMRRVRAEMSELLEANTDFYVAINLSPKHFADRNLPALIRSIFGAPFSSGRLVFEVTEREVMDGSNGTACEVIDLLRADGARVALDDFGTGYSSLRYLAQFRFDLLKIDKAFIDAIGTESVTAGLVDDMLAMAQRLGLKTVAEGVETLAQLEHLQKIGIDYVQGWHFSQALPVRRLKAYMRQYQPPE